MREFGLLHETNPNLPIPRLESSLHNDYESSLFLEFNVVDDEPMTNLEEVLGPPLTSLSLVAPSLPSTPVATSVSDSTFLASPVPLAQCLGLEMGEIFSASVRVFEDPSLT